MIHGKFGAKNRFWTIGSLAWAMGLAWGAAPAPSAWSLKSPNNAVETTVRLADSGGLADYPAGTRLYYSVSLEGTEVLPLSPLGLTRADQGFVDGLVFDSSGAERSLDETYGMATGKRSLCRNHAREMTLHFHNASGARLQLALRAYDDGIAFRYVFPESNAAKLTVTGEATGFRLPGGSEAWMLPYDTVATWSPAYEAFWAKAAAGTASPGPLGWCFPALFKTPAGAWILLAETEVTENYCGTHLGKNSPNQVYRIAFPNSKELGGQTDANPSWTLPWAMPWRIVMVGKTPGTMVESTLPTDLASPSAVADVAWIKPGRASWSWWSNPGSPRVYGQITPFVDLAAAMRWEYSLVDANWNQMSGGTWQGLADYAKAKNVGILLWYNSGGPYNTITEQPRDRIFDASVRKAEFKAIADAGVKGLKIDFWMSDKQSMMKYYRDVFKDAADAKLLVNLHGCTIPRGWQRTFPNLVSAEAIKGAEEYKFDPAYSAGQPARNVMFPFARNAVASMDYTPVIFSNTAQKSMNGATYYARTTTHAHELALSVVFESGIQHFADQVSGYTSLPGYAADFLKQVPAAWDDTKYLQGDPGTWMALARRKGKDWYVAGISGENAARSVAIPLSFLDAFVHTQELIMDGASKYALGEKAGSVGPADTLKVTLLPYGGFAAFLKRTGTVALAPRAEGKGPKARFRGGRPVYDANGRRIPGAENTLRARRPIGALAK